MKSEVMVEVSEGDGQVARACRGLKTKTWILGGVAADSALPIALRHLSLKHSLSAVVVNFQHRILNEFLNS